MASGNGNASPSEANVEKLYPAVAMYGPTNLRGLEEGQVKMWCACGLSKKQPWCDGSHRGTGMRPVRWTVPRTQTLYQVCLCKYTRHPPHCDGSHISVPLERRARVEGCNKQGEHKEECKLCTNCGWVPDF